jgi:hypothetical protein
MCLTRISELGLLDQAMASLFVTVGRPGELRCERFDCVTVAKGTPQGSLLHWHEPQISASGSAGHQYVCI